MYVRATANAPLKSLLGLQRLLCLPPHWDNDKDGISCFVPFNLPQWQLPTSQGNAWLLLLPRT